MNKLRLDFFIDDLDRILDFFCVFPENPNSRRFWLDFLGIFEVFHELVQRIVGVNLTGVLPVYVLHHGEDFLGEGGAGFLAGLDDLH